MLITNLILATSVSIDSLGIGISYGLKSTRLSIGAKIMLFTISIFVTSIAIILGQILVLCFPTEITKLIGSTILVFMGVWVIIQSTSSKSSEIKSNIEITQPKVYKFFIKYLGITIQIIRDPSYSDIDKSQKIDIKEALCLGIAMSIDSLCIGISSVMIGLSFMFFPLLVATFQLFFLSIGKFIGSKIATSSKIPQNIWTIISGSLLILMGICKIFC